jgi:hypothetical protein
MILTNVEIPACVPEDIKKPLGLLTGEVQDLHLARCMFWDLCIDQPETVTLINRTAPRFFRRVQTVIFEHLVLGIARLTDPLSTAGNRNLGLRDLFLNSPPTQLDALHAQAADIRKIRSKIVAHLDWRIGLDPSGLPGDKIFRKIRACTDLMVEVINLAWVQWADGGFTMLDSDAMEITNCLKKGAAYDEIEKAGGIMQNFWNAPTDMKREILAKIRAKSE